VLDGLQLDGGRKDAGTELARNDGDRSEDAGSEEIGQTDGLLLLGEQSFTARPAFTLRVPQPGGCDFHVDKLEGILKRPENEDRRAIRGCLRLNVLKFTVHVLYLDVQADTNEFLETVRPRLRKILNPLNSGLLDMQLKHKNSSFKSSFEGCDFMLCNPLFKAANSSLPLLAIYNKVRSS
jgi:hypothetical protein